MSLEISGMDTMSLMLLVMIGVFVLTCVLMLISEVVEAITKVIRTWIISNARVKVAKYRAEAGR